MTAKTLMIQGTASSVGKSLLVTALCRIFKRRGLSVAPFKSQNMSLNSYVTSEGHEMGRAQVSQARAAGLEPSCLMNPVLLKPCSNKKSQVIAGGRVRAVMSAAEYFSRKEEFLPVIEESFAALSARHDIIVIEGAGSPAEINLMEKDFVNMGMADMADAPVLLVGDIDRGGVFASLFGTIKLLPQQHQGRIKGMVVNKFRGDLSILEPGLRDLEAMLDIPVLGVLPYERFAIDEEDSLTERFAARPGQGLRIVVPRLPRIANFTDFAVFDTLPGCSVTYTEDAGAVKEADFIILPGSKNTVEDMRWLMDKGFGHAVREAAQRGTPVAGICGGFQMLGRAIHDPEGVESAPGSVEGLGLLDMETVFEKEKFTVRCEHRMEECPGILQGLRGTKVKGYEIHMGRSSYGPDALPLAVRIDGEGGEMSRRTGAVDARGLVFGTYLHGIFDNLAFTRRLISALTKAGCAVPAPFSQDEHYGQIQEKEYDRLAVMVEGHLDMDSVFRIAGL